MRDLTNAAAARARYRSVAPPASSESGRRHPVTRRRRWYRRRRDSRNRYDRPFARPATWRSPVSGRCRRIAGPRRTRPARTSEHPGPKRLRYAAAVGSNQGSPGWRHGVWNRTQRMAPYGTVRCCDAISAGLGASSQGHAASAEQPSCSETARQPAVARRRGRRAPHTRCLRPELRSARPRSALRDRNVWRIWVA
jgi:hypothetical protein